MTILVECDCGRKLRAPDQMAGRVTSCVCGKTVTLALEAKPPQFVEVEPELDDPEEDASPAPVVHKPRTVQKAGPRKSLFRPSQGRNIERGGTEGTATAPVTAPPRKKKRRHDKELATDRKRKTQEGFTTGLLRSLKFPFRVESALTIGFLATAYGSFTSLTGFMMFGFAGILISVATFLLLGYFSFFLLQIFRLATVDEDDMPLSMEFDMGQIVFDLWTWAGAIWWSGFPLAAYWLAMTQLIDRGDIETFEWWVPSTIAPGLLAGLVLLPMALLSATLHTTVLAANPWTVIRAIFRVPFQYLATLSVFGFLCITAGMVGFTLPPVPVGFPIVSQILTWILLFYALTASAYGFGNFYYRNRQKIGWFSELPRQIL